MNNHIRLTEPAIACEAEYRAYLAEFVAQNEPATFYREPEGTFAEFVAQLAREARGEGLEDWMVPQHTFWCLRDDGRMVGVIKVRHRLTPALEACGGHIGYFVRPSERGKGYATRILALALEHVQALGLSRVLLTCHTANRASARVIEKNGGVLAGEGISPRDGEPHLRYWITLCTAVPPWSSQAQQDAP